MCNVARAFCVSRKHWYTFKQPFVRPQYILQYNAYIGYLDEYCPLQKTHHARIAQNSQGHRTSRNEKDKTNAATDFAELNAQDEVVSQVVLGSRGMWNKGYVWYNRTS